MAEPSPPALGLGERLDVFFHSSSRECVGDFQRGEVVTHHGGEVYEVRFDDGDEGTFNLALDSVEVWRRPPPGDETAAERRRHVLHCLRELGRRDRNVGLAQERDAHAALKLEVEKTKLLAAAREQALLQGQHPARLVAVAEDAACGIVLRSGMVVLDPTASLAPFDADRSVLEWAMARCAEPHGQPWAECEVDSWLVGTFPFVMEERQRLFDDTGLVALAGHVDQTGIGESSVRVLFDDFALTLAPPLLVVPPSLAAAPGARARGVSSIAAERQRVPSAAAAASRATVHDPAGRRGAVGFARTRRILHSRLPHRRLQHQPGLPGARARLRRGDGDCHAQ